MESRRPSRHYTRKSPLTKARDLLERAKKACLMASPLRGEHVECWSMQCAERQGIR